MQLLRLVVLLAVTFALALVVFAVVMFRVTRDPVTWSAAATWLVLGLFNLLWGVAVLVLLGRVQLLEGRLAAQDVTRPVGR